MKKLKLEELNRMTPMEYQESEKLPLVVVLDNVRSALNVGAIFRSSDAFAIEKIVLTGITAKPPHREITKTAIGATRTVNWEYEKDVEVAIKQLKDDGHKVLGIEQIEGSISLKEYEYDGHPLAIVLGNEVDGISESVLPLLDQAIELTQYGTKHSLNVSVCAGVVLWHMSNLLRS